MGSEKGTWVFGDSLEKESTLDEFWEVEVLMWGRNWSNFTLFTKDIWENCWCYWTKLEEGRREASGGQVSGGEKSNNGGRIRKTSSVIEFERITHHVFYTQQGTVSDSHLKKELFHQIPVLDTICFYSISCFPRIFGSLKSQQNKVG